MTWAQRLKRVFGFDIETCRECGGTVKVIAGIEDPVPTKKILTHLKEKGRYGEIQLTTRESGASANKPVRLTEICTHCMWLQPWAEAAWISACLRGRRPPQGRAPGAGKDRFSNGQGKF